MDHITQLFWGGNKINEFTFGYSEPSTNMVEYTIAPKEDNSEVPFYFNPLEISSSKINRIGTYQITNMNIIKRPETPREIIKFIETFGLGFIKLMTKENPRKFKEKYQELLEFCESIGNLSYFLFTEKTTFTFPRNLLNTLRSFIYSGYESCGTIAVSKLRPKDETSISEEEKEFLKYNYEVIFHSDKEKECLSDFNTGGYTGEIMFHLHFINLGNQKEYTKFDPKKVVDSVYYDVIYLLRQCFNPPSRPDINYTRYVLNYGLTDIDMIFTYSGVYVMRLEKPVQEKNFEQGIGIEELNEQVLDNYWNSARYLHTLIQSYYGAENEAQRAQDFQRYRQHHMKGPSSEKLTEEDEFVIGYEDRMYQVIQKIMVNQKDINSLANYANILKVFKSVFPVVIQQFTKEVLEPYLNIDNKSGNKIIAEFVPVEYNEEKGIFEYRIFSVEVYPTLLMERRARAPRRLTIQN